MTTLFEAIWSAYGVLFEANAGNELRRGVDYLSSTFQLSREESREICQKVRQACFDIFSSDPTLSDKTKDPAVKAVIGLFMPVLRMLVEHCSIQERTPSSSQSIVEFGERFKATADAIGVHPVPGGHILSNDGTELSFEDIMSHHREESSVPSRSYAGRSRYTVVPITSHERAREFSDVLPFCLTWKTMQYWNDYTSNARYKVYFLLRDDYRTIEEPEDYNDDDDYARSAIGLVVNDDGSIRSLYNRRNRRNKIYDEDQLSEFLCRDFRSACPPYTEDERDEAMEQNESSDHSYERPPVTIDNFTQVVYDEYMWMNDEANNDNWDEVTLDNTLDDVSDYIGTYAWLDDDFFLTPVTITDSRDGLQYSAMFGVSTDQTEIYRITGWVDGDGYWDADNVTINRSKDNAYTTVFPSNYGTRGDSAVFMFSRTLYWYDLGDTSARKIWSLPDDYNELDGFIDNDVCLGAYMLPDPDVPLGTNFLLLTDPLHPKTVFDSPVDGVSVTYDDDASVLHVRRQDTNEIVDIPIQLR